MVRCASCERQGAKAQGNAASACAHASPPSSCACALRLCISLPARVPAPVRVRILACLLLSLFLCLLAGSELCVASALWVCLGVWWPRSLTERCLCLVSACPALPVFAQRFVPACSIPLSLSGGLCVCSSLRVHRLLHVPSHRFAN